MDPLFPAAGQDYKHRKLNTIRKGKNPYNSLLRNFQNFRKRGILYPSTRPLTPNTFEPLQATRPDYRFPGTQAQTYPDNKDIEVLRPIEEKN